MRTEGRAAFCLVICLLLVGALVLTTNDVCGTVEMIFTSIQLAGISSSSRRGGGEKMPANQSLVADAENGNGEKKDDAAVRLLYKQWEYLYMNSTNSTLSEEERKISMDDVGLHKSIPYPPHLEDCLDVERRTRKEEEIVGGTYPDWVASHGNNGDRNSCSAQPQPPWIRGADADNVPFTRIAQRDIWLQQHPPDCRDPKVKFAILEWAPREGYGLGSQLHLISTNIGKALALGRVAVPSFWQRAAHSGCEGANNGTLECYFLGMTTRECLQVALEEYGKVPPETVSSDLYSTDRIIRLGFWIDLDLPQSLKERWGGAAKWIDETPTVEIGGRLTRLNDEWMYVSWWHAQTTSYMFRWPSVRLCQLVNKARHQVYGMEVAEMVVEALNQRKKLDVGQPLFSSEALQSPPVSLDMEVWQKDEPYIPRPFVSIHVRQGDKGKEMQLFQLRDIMWNAERLRLKVPDLHHVWLSTEMQTVLEESKEYSPRWEFMYTSTHRMVGSESNFDYENDMGIQADLENSLVNLIIASQADYFVGTRGSNWNRLLDEFRKTRGRNKRGYISLNDGEARR